MSNATDWIDGKTTTQPSAATTTRGEHERRLAQLSRSVEQANRAARLHAERAADTTHVELRRAVDALRTQHADAVAEETRRQTASDAADAELAAAEKTHATTATDSSWREVEKSTKLVHRRAIELRGIKAKVADLDTRLRAAEKRLALYVFERSKEHADPVRFEASIDGEIQSILAAHATIVAAVKVIDAKLAAHAANVDEMEAARAAAGVASPGCARLAGAGGCALTIGATTSSCSSCVRRTRGRALYLVQLALRMRAVGKPDEEAARVFDASTWITPWSGAISK